MHIKTKWSCHRTDEKTTTALKKEKEAFMMVAAFYRTYNWKKRKQVPLPMHAKK
jgi:hypothetical protein